MSWRRSFSRGLLGAGVVLLGAAGTASAQNATLYEVTETMKVRGRGAENRTRTATATLSGTIEAGTTLCPTELAFYLGIARCGVVATASDSLSLTTGKGPVRGRFAVVIPGDNPIDGHEFMIARGTISGAIDLAAALLQGMPLGSLDGKWSAEGERGGPLDGLRVRGRVSGVFRLPFVHGDPDHALYLFGDFPNYYPLYVRKDEHSLGVPTVRLDLSFETTAQGRAGERDDD